MKPVFSSPGRALPLAAAQEVFGLIRDKVHHSLLKARDAYRAYIKRGRSKVLLDRYNKMLGLHVTVAEFEHARKRTDCDEEEYFGYEFYRRTDEERDAYLTRNRRTQIVRKIGDEEEALTIPGNKLLFNLLFGEFLGREWINPTAASEEEFVAFVRRMGAVIVKPTTLFSGQGIYKYHYTDDAAARALYAELFGRGFMVEQVLRQHPALDQINPDVINTVRVATYTDADDVHILAAALRTSGREGVCVDNLHAGGCGCAVDVETGVVVSDGFNNDFARLREHPLTHVPFKGFQIPMWDEARATVEKIARKAYLLPQCRYIGWDLAFTPEGIAVIEGNWRQTCDLIQYAHKGIYHELKALSQKL